MFWFFCGLGRNENNALFVVIFTTHCDGLQKLIRIIFRGSVFEKCGGGGYNILDTLSFVYTDVPHSLPDQLMYTIQSRCFENGYGTTCIISWVVWWCCGWSSPSRPPPSPSPSCSSSSASSGRLSSASLPDRFKVNCTILFHYIRQSNGLIQKSLTTS